MHRYFKLSSVIMPFPYKIFLRCLSRAYLLWRLANVKRHNIWRLSSVKRHKISSVIMPFLYKIFLRCHSRAYLLWRLANVKRYMAAQQRQKTKCGSSLTAKDILYGGLLASKDIMSNYMQIISNYLQIIVNYVHMITGITCLPSFVDLLQQRNLGLAGHVKCQLKTAIWPRFQSSGAV